MVDPRFPNDPTKRVKPTPRLVARLIGILLKISHHEALLFGLYASRDMKALSAPVQQLNDGEIDKRLSRLISAEVDEFMRLVRKMEGRGVDLGPEIGYEREARLAAAEARREANPEEEAELEVRINQSGPGPKPWVQPEMLSYLEMTSSIN